MNIFFIIALLFPVLLWPNGGGESAKLVLCKKCRSLVWSDDILVLDFCSKCCLATIKEMYFGKERA